MECLTIEHGRLIEGIQTVLSEKTQKRLVFLGEKGGKFSHYELIKFSRFHQPKVDENGRIYHANPVEFKAEVKNSKSGKIFEKNMVYLSKSYKDRPRFLVRINTSSQVQNDINGTWETVEGWPKQLVSAGGFSKGQRWCDDLVILDDMDVIRVTPAGSRRTDRMIVRNDCGELTILQELEYLQILKDHQDEVRRELLRNRSTKNTESPEKEKVDEKGTEEIKSESPTSDDEGKAPQFSEIVIHAEEGATIGV